MADAHPLEALFSPKSVAIVGASRDPSKLGGRPLRNLIQFGYAGRIYPVNPSYPEVQGLRAYPSVTALPEVPDQAIVVVPAQHVPAALEDCAAKGVRVVQILSAGFAEVGGAGVALQDEVVRIIRRTGLRITGPNALGSVCPADHFYGTFSSLMDSLRPPAGRVGVVTQSGAFGSHVYAVAAQRGIGLSRSVATGNEANIDVAACIEALAADSVTTVICAALEGCRDGDRLRAALRLAAQRGKPVVVMKVGSTEVGAKAAATHTGSLAGSDAAFDAVFRECGAWRARSIEEMVDIAYLCATAPAPAGDSLSIVTISGGLGVLMADRAVELGLRVPAAGAELQTRLRDILPYVSGVNPIDTTAQVAGTPQKMAELIDAMQQDAPAGAVILYLSHVARAPERFGGIQGALASLRERHPGMTLVFVGTSVEQTRTWLEGHGTAVFEDPSRAVAAIRGAVGLRQLRDGMLSPDEIDLTAMRGISVNARDEIAAKAVLREAGIPVLEERVCSTATEAVQAAQAMGFPVVAKIVSPDIAHKTEVGGVALNLGDAETVAAAFDAIMANVRRAKPEAVISGLLITPMRRDGIETIIGTHIDPVFGPMVMFGLGGVTVELFRDVAFASAPLDRAGALRLIGSVRSAPLLKGWRGSAPVDLDALADAVMRVSQLAAAHAGSIASIEVNPFLINESGGVALDALLSRRILA